MLRNILLQLIVLFQFCATHGSAIVWSTATASYQIEGSRWVDGRQASIWDAFDTDGVSKDFPALTPSGHPHIFAGESGQFADGDYTRFRDSASIVSDGGFGMVRMSISWPRVMTYTLDEVTGDLSWKRNEAGIQHYKDVMEAYQSKQVQIALTMFHWDLPLLLEKKAQMNANSSFWLSHDWAPAAFGEYAKLLLKEYKWYVSWWITINEPLTIITNGYTTGSHAPGRCSDRALCYHGDSTTEPYEAAKGLILGHGHAFQAWFEAGQPGKCGMTLNCDWRIPFTNSDEDKAAAERSLEWSAAIFFDPIYRGDWPESMKKRVGNRLPKWSKSEKKLLGGTHDEYFFMNTYTTNFARAPKNDQGDCGYYCDMGTETSGRNFTSGKPIGTPSSNGWLFNYGPGMGKLIAWYNRRYPGLSYVITENGWGTATASKEEAMLDLERCNFYRDYLGNLSAIAVSEGYEVAAYTAWSVMDNYEWSDGYSTRFGLVYVDYQTMERLPKLSYKWFQKHITPLKRLPTDGLPLPPCDPSEFEKEENLMV